mgnify:FL=1
MMGNMNNVLVIVFASAFFGPIEPLVPAMYIIPFLVAPAAHMIDCIGHETRSIVPLAATVCFLAAQCWFTETMLYTYW